jgi:hypothetical protein
LESWLGAEEAKAPAMIIEQAQRALEWAVRSRISRSKEDFFKKFQDPARREEIIDRSATLMWTDHTWDGRYRTTCPACASLAFLGGTLWNEEVVDSDSGGVECSPEGEEYYMPPFETVEKTFTVEVFTCLVCKLSLDGTKEIEAAQLPMEFSVKEDRDIEYGPDYGND